MDVTMHDTIRVKGLRDGDAVRRELAGMPVLEYGIDDEIPFFQVTDEPCGNCSATEQVVGKMEGLFYLSCHCGAQTVMEDEPRVTRGLIW